MGLQNNPNKNEDKKHAWQLPSKCRGLANKKNPQQICREQCREQLLVNLNKNASPQKKENSKNKFHPEKVDFSSFFSGKPPHWMRLRPKVGLDSKPQNANNAMCLSEKYGACVYTIRIYIYIIFVYFVYTLNNMLVYNQYIKE